MFFAAITFSVAGGKYLQFRAFGGSYVAESVGAHRVDPNTPNSKLRQLLNIVEEVAVASSLPIPPVYILETQQLNAFAAGLGKDDAAVTVTRGCLDLLNRDELQGVIAHEFGHIYNADMKISMRLAAMVMGFFFVLYIAMRLLQFSPRQDSRDNAKNGNPLIIAALILTVAGTFTWLFGSILKAAVSREREYLADACAVQFTRNPDGIANALLKIGRQSSANQMPKEGMAFSHLYLDDRGGLSEIFATHPPLKKRIEAIRGRTYMPEEWKQDFSDPT
jgi:heat shock protein HtpX